MSQVELKAPKDMSGFSIEGREIKIVDGIALVDERDVPDLISHGFTGTEILPPGSRQSNVALAATAARTVIESLSDAQLADFAGIELEDAQKFWEGFADGLVQYPKHLADKAAVDAADRLAQDKIAADAAAKAAADASTKTKTPADPAK